jgi:hypothetical protein
VERHYKVHVLKTDVIKSIDKTENTGAESNKLFPTNTAMIVNDFLVEHFPDITNYSFTAEIEQEFDEIASGKLKWQTMLGHFYKPFHKTVEKTEFGRTLIGSQQEQRTGCRSEDGQECIREAWASMAPTCSWVKTRMTMAERNQSLRPCALASSLRTFRSPMHLSC